MASKHCLRFGKASVVKHTLYKPAFKSVSDQSDPVISSGVWENPGGPPETATVNENPRSPFILTLMLPLSELLHVSSVCSTFRVSLGIG